MEQREIILLGLAALAVTYQVIVWIYNAWFHPLSGYPGPKLFGASYLPGLYHRIRGDYVLVHTALHERFGEVIRVSPNELSYINPQAWKDITGQGSGRQDMEKDPLSFGRPMPNAPSIFNAHRMDHSRIRRTMSHAFSASALRRQESLIQSHVKMMIQCLREHNEEVVDMVSWYNFTTFDMFGDLAFGESFGCLTNSLYHPWVKMLIMSMKAGYFIIQAQKYPIFEKVLMSFIPRMMRQRRRDHLALTQAKLAKRMAKPEERPDFLSFILRHQDEATGMSLPELEINASTLIVAGSETTATLLSGCTYYLLRNPRVMEKLLNEVRTTFKSEDEIDITTVNGLKYMLAVLDEALRVYPPAPGNFHRLVPKEGSVICEKFVPGETQVSVCHYAAYHSPCNFHQPDEFIPERFLGESKFENDRRDVLQPFGTGSRACLGRNLAYFEMRLILTHVLWNFDLELMPQSKYWANQKVFAIWDKPELYVKLKPRAGLEVRA
uniref:Cytochrome P450 monooxygenase astA n=1 Tax=Talaromyces wortmannii TaxID=28567 RepID=ASTA_TALWO|nr:RecName: Full=Cytochrome P450 monooxygenase astA; AltName: Full=Asperterpenoid biosynthesis cluster protein A [Talaromyces wortmannii]AZQ56742.1 cytochrome P450 [Talaromyces wortmannii]